MTRDIINVQYPTLDHTESIANICIEKFDVTPEKGITIEEAFSNKNNSKKKFNKDYDDTYSKKKGGRNYEKNYRCSFRLRE